jgi:alpha-N-arabinofuranosidase
MNKRTIEVISCAIIALLFSLYSSAQQQIVVQVNKPLAPIQPTMWGVFFEDINMGADGGIYAELVKNRSFEFFKPMMGWKVLGKPLTEGDFLV